MSEMIDRVAAAICLADLPDHEWAEIDPLWQEKFRGFARAAIKVMRQATPEMCEAGFQHTGDPCWPEDVGKAWAAMIDAALA